MTNLPKIQLLMMGTLLSLPGLETPTQNAVAQHMPGPPVQQVLVRLSQGCPGKCEEGDVKEDISNLVL